MAYVGKFAANGSMNVSVVAATPYCGLYAADGSMNVIVAPGGSYVGATAPNGAQWVTVSPGTLVNLRAPDGSLYVTLNSPPSTNSGLPVTVVSGSLSSFIPSGIVFDGDSITSGTGTNTTPYPTYFSTLTKVRNKNKAIPGESFTDMDINYATAIAPLFSVGVFDALSIMAGTNDLSTLGLTDLNLRTIAQSYCGKARATGFKVYVGTITARNIFWDATKEGYRVAYNTWLRANFGLFCDGMLDLDAVPQSQDPANTTWVQDGLHPTNALAALYGNVVRTMVSLPNSSFAFNTSVPSGSATFADSNKSIILGTASTCVLGNVAITGKKVFTVSFDSNTFSFSGIGVGIAAATSSPGFDGNKSICCFDNSGAIIQNSVQIGTGPSYGAENGGGGTGTPASPTLVSGIIDEPNARIWFTLDGVTFTGLSGALTKAQVEAGTSPFDISAIKALGALFPVCGSFSNSGQKWRLEAYPVAFPIGYTAL